MKKEEVEWERYKGDKPIMMKHGFELFLRSNCEYSRKRFIYKIAESNEIDFLKKNWCYPLSKDLVCFDIGANIGYWSKFLADMLKVKHVYSFEPDPISFKILKKNLKNSYNCSCFNLGIYSSFKKIKLFIDPYHSGDNRPIKTKGRDSIPIQTISIDHFVDSNNLQELDFIKMDIQGGEYDALEGARKTINRFRPILLVEIDQKLSPNLTGYLKRFCEKEKYKLIVINNMRKEYMHFEQLEKYEGNILVCPS